MFQAVTKKLPSFAGLILFATLSISITTPTAMGQASPAKPTPANLLTFDVVSVRRNLAAMGPDTARFDFPANGDGLTMTDILLSSIVGTFYGFNQDSQSGMPAWANAECYDIRAKVAESDLAAYHQLTRAQRNKMVQAVLENRFKLSTHQEQREASIYALTIAKNGPKIKEATPGEVYTSSPKGPDGQFQSGSLFIGGEGEQIAHAIPMSLFANSLKSLAGRQVVDRTGLTAKFDFTFKWNGNPNDPDAPSLFTALQEQLGLKLEPAKGMVQTLVIDHIERPSEN
jgi:uncharacterized protein (TIGR03435 family)